MNVLRAFKTELDLNHAQATACKRHAGAARYAYNWGLARKQDVYEATGKSLSAIDLHRELNALKKTELSWLYDVSKCAPQEALRNLDTTFAQFFRRCALQREGKLKGAHHWMAQQSIVVRHTVRPHSIHLGLGVAPTGDTEDAQDVRCVTNLQQSPLSGAAYWPRARTDTYASRADRRSLQARDGVWCAEEEMRRGGRAAAWRSG